MAIATFKYFLIQTEFREVRHIISTKRLNYYSILMTFPFKDTMDLNQPWQNGAHNQRAGNVYSSHRQWGSVPANEMSLFSVARLLATF